MYIRLFITFIVFISWFSWAHHYYICEVRNLCHPSIPLTDSVKFYNVAHTLKLKAGEYIILDNYPEFCFDFASPQAIELAGHKAYYAELVDFLNKNPEAELRITGRYLQKEQAQAQKQGRYNDLGIARAMAVVDKLHNEFRIDNRRLHAHSQAMVQDTLVAPIDFEALNYTPPLADNRLDSPKIAELPDTNLINQIENSLSDVTYFDKSMNFDYGSQTFDPGSDFLVYVDSIASYFKKNPTHTLLIIGHTDTKGETKFNEQLGLRRADAVRQFLIKKSIKASIKTESKGETEPILPDQNPDGSYIEAAMSKNRRVNIKIMSK
jgi:outer membrane protein OmpA-like peptidoglycan-associated protein